MATQLLTLTIIASETSADEVKEIISGCQLGDISGTVNTKHRDFSAEDILEELSQSGIHVQRAEHLEDDGASVLNITMFVPDEQKAHLEKWIAENHMNGESIGALVDFSWGVKVGDKAEFHDTFGWKHSFSANVIGFRQQYVQVEDDGGIFDIELKHWVMTLTN